MLDELKKIGLSENEAKVYLALLDLGNSTAQQIAQKASVNRATTYVQLESLMKMGLVTSFERASARKNGAEKTFFRAEDPEHLKKIIEREKNAAEEREKHLEKIMPSLANLFLEAGERPRVRFFEGAEGLKIMQDEFLKTKSKEVLSITSTDDILKVFPKHPEEYTPKRVKLEIHSKLIYTSSRGAFLKASDEALLREAKFIPREQFPVPAEISIYGDIVAIDVAKEKPFGVIIESREIAESMKTFFSLAWEAAEKYNK